MNRRLGREYVLDVKLRASQVRSARIRLAGLALGVIFGSVLGVFLVWRGGAWALNALVYENKAFAIEELDVQTDGIITVDQLKRWAGVRPGENLLALDSARVQRDLRLISQIQNVSVERIVPHTLRIRVTERQPIAQLPVFKPGSSGGIERSVFQLDADGYVIVPLEVRQRTSPSNQATDVLPLIYGVSPNEIQAGRKIEVRQLRAALELLVAFERSPMQGLSELKSIDISAPEVLNVVTIDGGQITFGLVDLDQQLRRWRAIFEMGQERSKAIASLDLAVTNSIPVVFQDGVALPPLSPKPAKQLKRKHV
jgi:cell division septal protein FtsQ